MRYEISGTVMQTVSIDFGRGKRIYSQMHARAWISDGVAMATGGGLFAGLRRVASGGSLFITDYSGEQSSHIAFAPHFLGKIMRCSSSLISR